MRTDELGPVDIRNVDPGPQEAPSGASGGVGAFVLCASMPFIAMLAGEVIGAWLPDRVDKRAAACFISMAGAAVGL